MFVTFLVESVVYDQLETYLDERKLLYNLPKIFYRYPFDNLTYFIKFQMDKENVVLSVSN